MENGGEDGIVEIMEVPDHCVGLVIGRGGEQIQAIQANAGCKVQMAQNPNANNCREVTLTGNREAIERAKGLIAEVVSNAKSSPNNGANGQMGNQQKSLYFEMAIPGRKCGLIIGKNGETIKNLQGNSGAKMMLVQDNHSSGEQPKILKISGGYEQVENAKKMVEEILRSHDANNGDQQQRSSSGPQQQMAGMPARSNPGMPQQRYGGGTSNQSIPSGGNPGEFFVGEVIVPKSAVGMIIGKAGDTIKRLAQETGSKIQFKPDTNPEGQDRTAVIQGNASQISHATRLISEIVAKCGGGQPTDVQYMTVPGNKTGLVIGKGGETIKALNAESGAHIELARDAPCGPNEKVFSIKGTAYCIHVARHLIGIKVGDIPQNTDVPSFTGNGGGNFSNYQGGGGAGANYMAPGGQGAWNANSAAYPQQGAGTGGSQWSGAQDNYYQQQGGYNATPAGQQYSGGAGYNGTQASGAVASSGGARGVSSGGAGGQPDYSAQWAQYYRSIGMIDQANLIELQMKSGAGGGASAEPQSTPAYTANFDGPRNGGGGRGSSSAYNFSNN
uniref:KH domain-containing protein n=1 Tax=Rhabditophanes sp. KR3021 TaxID=114890 RepID=A0AC35U2P4_9BILA